MPQFKTLQDVALYFSNEDRGRDFLEKMRWPDGRIICPVCGVRDAYRNGDCKTYKCRDKDCKTNFSVTVGTIMEGTKLPLAKWFMAMYLISAHKKGISSCQLARDLGIGQKAAWFLNHRIRAMMADGSGSFLSGVVEIDETYHGGKHANMKKSKRKKLNDAGIDNKVPVMGMVQRDGKAKLQVIGKNSFKTVVHANVKREAIVITDSHLGYVGLDKDYADHQSVNHSQLEFKRGIYYTNTVEGFFGLFKRSVIGIYHQISEKHLQRYCDEMTFRFNSRKDKDGDRFIDTFNNMQGRRLTYKQLIGEGRKPKHTGIEFVEEG
jgi:transposase-like protein